MDFQEKAKIIVKNYFDDHAEKTDDFELNLDDIYTVWFSKTLQNWKVLISTNVNDGMYYEVTYNGDKEETYLDAYKKFKNVSVTDEEFDRQMNESAEARRNLDKLRILDNG